MKENNYFPKVLIIGQTFHLNNGGGITLTNLFKGWPLDRIAVASEGIESSGFDHCINYYEFGYLENKRPWPFYKFQRRKKSGPVDILERKKTIDETFGDKQLTYGETGIKSFFLNIRHYLGIYPFIYRLRVSDKFLEWINDFQPEIIYTQLSNFKILNLITQLLDEKQIPLAIHIMDDWPKTLKEPGLLYFYWKWFLNHNIRKLINNSKVLMSICPAMSEEYLKRYKHEFIPFQNTIEVAKIIDKTHKDYDIQGAFTILYAGRIGKGTYNSVLMLAKAIELLGKEGLNILLKIRAGILPREYSSKIDSYTFTKLDDFLSHEKMPEELSAVDLLVIPLDFANIKFTRLSMPTKVPEFLVSGTPVLVFAPKTTALYKYANTLKWGYTISENSIEYLTDGIRKLYNDIELRESLGAIGKNVAKKNHDGVVVREKFRNLLYEAAH